MSNVLGTRGLTEPFTYGRGYQELVRLAQPAAGLTATLGTSGDAEVRPIAARARLVTSATVADRILSLDYLDQDGYTFSRNGAAVLVQASTTIDFFWHVDRGVAEWNVGTPVFAPLADIFLEPGWSIRFQVDLIQAGDQLSLLSLLLEKFPTGRRGYPEGATYGRRRR